MVAWRFAQSSAVRFFDEYSCLRDLRGGGGVGGAFGIRFEAVVANPGQAVQNYLWGGGTHRLRVPGRLAPHEDGSAFARRAAPNYLDVKRFSTPSKDLAFASGFGLGALASLGEASGAAFSRDIVFVSASALVDLLRRAGKCRVEQNGFALEASNARAAPAAAGRPTPVADLPRRNGSRRPVRSRG